MDFQRADGDVQVLATGHPADNATSTVLTGASAKSIPTNDFNELVIQGFLKDPETGAKAFNLQLYGGAAASGTVGSTGWTEIAEATVEALSGKDHDPVLAAGGAGAAYEGVYEWRFDMRGLGNYAYVNAILTVTHVDPTATPVTYCALFARGANKHNVR